jgi:hypothetical protein
MLLKQLCVCHLLFQAELKVGDMILAVNTESFLTVSYDEVSFGVLAKDI